MAVDCLPERQLVTVVIAVVKKPAVLNQQTPGIGSGTVSATSREDVGLLFLPVK